MQDDEIRELVLGRLGEVLGAEVNPGYGFVVQGGDSLMAIIFSQSFEDSFGITIPADELLQSPSIESLVAKVCDGLDAKYPDSQI